MFGGVVFIMMVMLVITSLAYDERSRWDRYALTMPVSRQEMVLSKYLLGLILLTFALFINIIFLILLNPSPLGEVLILTLSLFGIGLISLSILLPLMYKYGVENGRLLLILVLFVPMAAVLMITRMGLAPPGETFIQASAHHHPGYNGPGCAPIHPDFSANLSAQRYVIKCRRYDSAGACSYPI